MTPGMSLIGMIVAVLMVLALAGAALGVAVVAYNIASSASDTGGKPGPIGLTGATGSTGPEGPPGPGSFDNVTNGLTVRDNVLYWGGTLVEGTTIQQEDHTLKFLFGPYTEIDFGRVTLSPTSQGGALTVSWNGQIAVSGALLLDDGSKREVQTMFEWAQETPLTWYQRLEGENRKRAEHMKRAIVGVQAVLVHGNTALDDLSIAIAQEFGVGLINLDPLGNNAQVVVTDFGITLTTDQTAIEIIPGNGELYFRNLDEDLGATADQVLVRSSSANGQVLWSSFSNFIGADNGLTLTGSTVEWGGTLTQNTQVDQELFTYTQTYDGFTSLVISDSLTLSPSNGQLFVGNLDQDTLIEADEVLLRSHSSDRVFWQERTPVTVYVDNTDPNGASIFSLINPPTVDDPVIHGNIRYTYVGTDGSQWTYDGSVYNPFAGFVATDQTAGSSCSMYNSVLQKVPATEVHLFDVMQLNWGPSVYCNPLTNTMLLRYRGIYEVSVIEYLDPSTITSSTEVTILANGSPVLGSVGYMSTDPAVASTSKISYAIIKADSDQLITVQTTASTGTPFIGPNCVLSAKQIYWF